MVRVRPSVKQPRRYAPDNTPVEGSFVKLDARVENIGVTATTFWVGGWRIQIKNEDVPNWVKKQSNGNRPRDGRYIRLNIRRKKVA